MLRYHLSGEWMASPDPVRFTIKRFNENMTQNYNNGVIIITEPGYYTVTAYFYSKGDTFTQIMKNYNGIARTGALENPHILTVLTNSKVLKPLDRRAKFQDNGSGTITATIKLEMLDTVHIRLDRGKTNSENDNYNGLEVRKIN